MFEWISFYDIDIDDECFFQVNFEFCKAIPVIGYHVIIYEEEYEVVNVLINYDKYVFYVYVKKVNNNGKC